MPIIPAIPGISNRVIILERYLTPPVSWPEPEKFAGGGIEQKIEGEFFLIFRRRLPFQRNNNGHLLSELPSDPCNSNQAKADKEGGGGFGDSAEGDTHTRRVKRTLTHCRKSVNV